MANDINGIGRGAGAPRNTGPQTSATTGGAGSTRGADGITPAGSPGGASPAAGTDRVSLTGASESLREAETLAREASGVDSARVDEIRSAISEGRYRIDTAQLAERLLADESLLG